VITKKGCQKTEGQIAGFREGASFRPALALPVTNTEIAPMKVNVDLYSALS